MVSCDFACVALCCGDIPLFLHNKIVRIFSRTIKFKYIHMGQICLLSEMIIYNKVFGKRNGFPSHLKKLKTKSKNKIFETLKRIF